MKFMIFRIRGVKGVLAINLDLHPNRLLNFLKVLEFIARAECHALAASSRASRPADSVHIRFSFKRHIKVHHMGDIVDIDSSSGDVGCDQYPNLAIAKPIEDSLPCVLRTPSVNSFCRDSCIHQGLEQPVGPMLGSNENKDP
jgi:hypothetical protein